MREADVLRAIEALPDAQVFEMVSRLMGPQVVEQYERLREELMVQKRRYRATDQFVKEAREMLEGRAYGFDAARPAAANRKYLFIGGVADGQWINADTRHDHHRARGASGPIPIPDPEQWETYVTESTYKKVAVTIGSLRGEFYVDRTLGTTDEELAFVGFERLMRHYRPRAFDDCRECDYRNREKNSDRTRR